MESEIINNIAYLFFLVNITIFVSLGATNVYAHIPQDNKSLTTVQEWKDQQDKVKIQFSYSPEKPLIYNKTDLIFSVQDLNTGNHITDLIASITITKNDRIFFKFNDLEIQNGDLSLEVQFLEDGNYQVISQIRSAESIAIALASFNIHVPLQPFGKFSADSLSLSSLYFPAGLVVIGLSISIIALILLSKRRQKEEKDEDNN